MCRQPSPRFLMTQNKHRHKKKSKNDLHPSRWRKVSPPHRSRARGSSSNVKKALTLRSGDWQCRFDSERHINFTKSFCPFLSLSLFALAIAIAISYATRPDPRGPTDIVFVIYYHTRAGSNKTAHAIENLRIGASRYTSWVYTRPTTNGNAQLYYTSTDGQNNFRPWSSTLFAHFLGAVTLKISKKNF